MRHAILLLTLVGCAPTLTTNDPDAGARPDAGAWTGEGIPPESGAFTHSVDQGVVRTLVDATDPDDWHHLDMDSGRSVARSDGWELAFSRFRVRINGGATGDGGVQVAELDGVAFEDVTEAPEDGWTVPGPDGEGDEDTEPDNAFNDGVTDWYDYDEDTHTLTPRDVTYVVASTEGAFFKLAFDAYYDDAGSPAYVAFHWAAIDAPPRALPDAGPSDFDAGVPLDAGTASPYPDHAFELDAEDPFEWVYLSVEGGVVTPSDPESDPSWDLAFRRAAVRSNSGTSGAGLGGAREYDGELAYDAIERASTFGFAEDEVYDTGMPGAEPESLSRPLQGWYDYDGTTHRVTAGDRVYLLRTADGGYAKLRIWAWDSGRYVLSLLPVARHVEVRELDLDASDDAAWTHVGVRAGAVVEPTDPATDLGWDVAFSRARVRTNGGTSGAGDGAAIQASEARVADLSTAPSSGFARDALFDGVSESPALRAWRDPVTGAPRPHAYVIRSADGSLGALRVLTHEDGVYRLELAYAGPGHTTFIGETP